MPFERASHALEELTNICVSPKEAERITEKRGVLLDESLRSEGELLLIQGETSPSPNGVWAVALDAGRVRYEDGWHDVKAGVVFEASAVYDTGGGGERVGAVAKRLSYVAEVGSMEEAGERLSTEACRRGIGPDEKVVCLGDGAASKRGSL